MENFFIFISSFKETVNQINCDNVDYSKEKLNKEIQKIETYVNRFKEEEIEFLYKKLKKIALYTLKTVQIEAKLTFEGGEIKAEKILLNKLFIPFSQIIRNAIIHGLLYKEGERVIKIKAEKINDVLYFYFENNGEAIDKKVIKKKLLEKNIKFLDEDIVNAIFLPNFSTKSEEDLFSGRGIGLDLVKNEIDKLKGKISVFSEKEMGTVFSIEIPSKRKNYQEVAYE
jgi:two-component system chemotaxis sensor kinase CheA